MRDARGRVAAFVIGADVQLCVCAPGSRTPLPCTRTFVTFVECGVFDVSYVITDSSFRRVDLRLAVCGRPIGESCTVPVGYSGGQDTVTLLTVESGPKYGIAVTSDERYLVMSCVPENKVFVYELQPTFRCVRRGHMCVWLFHCMLLKYQLLSLFCLHAVQYLAVIYEC